MSKLLLAGLLTTSMMTPMERAAGRFMRAPDHPGGGDGGDGGDGGSSEPEPSGEEINDDVVVEGTPAGRSAGSAEDDSEDGDGADSEEGRVADEPKSVEERIGELTRDLREEQRKNAERDRDINYWRGRAEGTINEDGSPVKGPDDDRTVAPDDPDRPNPDDYQYGETDAAYIRDLARYEARAAYAEEREQAAVAEQLQTVENQHAERVTKAKERYTDYDEVVVKGAEVDAEGNAKWACSPLLALGIKTSDFGPDIAYELASNPEESLRISQLSPLEQAKEFGRLEYKAEMQAKADGRLGEDQGTSTTKRVTNAPEPPPRTRGAGGKFEASDDTDDFTAFEQKVDAKAKGKKRHA